MCTLEKGDISKHNKCRQCISLVGNKSQILSSCSQKSSRFHLSLRQDEVAEAFLYSDKKIV